MHQVCNVGIYYCPHVTEARTLTQCVVWVPFIMTYIVLRVLLRHEDTSGGDERTPPTPTHDSVSDYAATYNKRYTCNPIRLNRRMRCQELARRPRRDTCSGRSSIVSPIWHLMFHVVNTLRPTGRGFSSIVMCLPWIIKGKVKGKYD
jgi:hypothetical protein